ncbi:MAG: glycoside hydrolase family 25 protein [Lachnospiraceae bacterium]|nr:glycoside hydrolase family 25 protein [Lachnospiraceae bacterium]
MKKKALKETIKTPVIIIIAAVVIIGVIVACLISCTGKKPKGIDVTQPALHLEDSKWSTSTNGRKSYDNEKYKTYCGIDVSEWTGEIDWERAKNDGIQFAIMRVGYRGYETGKFVFDSNLRHYLKGAVEAGIDCGVYFVSQAINEEEAREEADMILEQVYGIDLTMPVYIDLEAAGGPARTDTLTTKDYTNIINAFCERVEENGFRGGIYSNETWITRHLDWNNLTQWDLWFAKYTEIPATDYLFNVWQYSDTAQIDGIANNCDINIRICK